MHVCLYKICSFRPNSLGPPGLTLAKLQRTAASVGLEVVHQFLELSLGTSWGADWVDGHSKFHSGRSYCCEWRRNALFIMVILTSKKWSIKDSTGKHTGVSSMAVGCIQHSYLLIMLIYNYLCLFCWHINHLGFHPRWFDCHSLGWTISITKLMIQSYSKLDLADACDSSTAGD